MFVPARTLFVTDLDGTLLGADLKISSESAAILNELIGAGVLITAATARARESTRRALAGVDLCLPVAFLNGGYLADLHGEQIQGGFPLPTKTTSLILEGYLECGLHPLVYTIDAFGKEHVFYQGTGNPGMHAYVAERLSGGDRRLRQVADLSVTDTQTVIAINAVDTPERLAPMREQWSRDAGVCCHYSPDIYVSGYCWLEICEFRANKGQAALTLKELVGAERMVCFGDNTNDLAMFAAADESYAVANAHPAVLDAATAVIGDHRSHAVARQLRELARAETR
ncbi:HAD family hydrolase [Catenulispora subtropica]|uniref:Cof-type HAD-IIB family hydrolase n=1 Tax=Catenulispora subtropica TaxID=450798 RepID=A0ABP5EF21_9ACTN